jgi:hypothetical protein
MGDEHPVCEWLNRSYQRQLIDNIDLRGEDATRGQGYAEALRDILGVINEARTLAAKFK